MAWKTQVPHFGATGRPETYAETSFPNGRNQLGYVYEEGTKRWQLFKVVDAAVTAAGDVLYIKNYASYEATPTLANSTIAEPAGVAELASSAANTFMWLRQGGLMDVKSEASLDGRGDLAYPNSANNSAAGLAPSIVAGTGVTVEPIGVAQAARNGGTGKTSVFLNIASI